MSRVELGSRPSSEDLRRDAVHVPVIRATTCARMSPGQRVLIWWRANELYADLDLLGEFVVDPFLDGPIEAHTKVWLLLKPDTVSGLRHHWTHPDLPESEPTEKVPYNEDEADDGCRAMGCN